ncbi:MAG: DUF3574 domain-containing protein [Bryobacteraceae bacterium]|nr:DUF3574 domain-containing protein [Bryobacteraceae bacterium]
MSSLSLKKLFATITLFFVLLPAAQSAETLRRPTASAAEVWARTELYFGTNKSNNQQVTEAEFAGFVDNQVTTRFPDGLTLLTGYGQFKGSNGLVIREKSYVLILFYPPQTQDANKKIQEIRDRYKSDFGQESVLRVDSFSLVSF